MIRSYSILVLAAAFQVIFTQNFIDDRVDGPIGPYSAYSPQAGRLVNPYQVKMPRQCRVLPAGIRPRTCCTIPSFYDDEVMDACGIEKVPFNTKPTWPGRLNDYYCEKGMCLMKKSNLLNEDNSVNYTSLMKRIDDWAHANTNISEAILKAKDKCVGNLQLLGSRQKCIPHKLYFCMTAHILWNCDLRQDLKNCVILKAHMNKCRPFYKKPVDGPIEPTFNL